MIDQPMYRTYIVEYPEFEEYYAFDERNGQDLVPWERPVGWTPTPEYIEHYESNKYFEPSTSRWYKSRSSAADRANLLNSMGYVAIVQRSAPVQWPAAGEKKVNDSETAQVAQAIRVLKRAGLIESADELFGGRR